MANVPQMTLNNGVTMPALGLGVYRSKPDETAQAIRTALDNGYRLFDTAAAYGNEREVGEGLRQSGIEREDVFVTTKLWLSFYGYERALHGFDLALKKLRLEYLDLFLLHWPAPSTFAATVDAFKALARLRDDGHIRAIGVCNFNPDHLERLIAETGVVPAVNQVELHPFLIQRDVREADKRLGILTEAWSPIGGVNVYWAKEGEAVRNPLEHPAVMQIAARHGKTPAQVVLRWHHQHGNIVIPKSVKPERIRENIDIFDFSLSKEEVGSIDAIDSGKRGGPDPNEFDLSKTKIQIEE